MVQKLLILCTVKEDRNNEGGEDKSKQKLEHSVMHGKLFTLSMKFHCYYEKKQYKR